MTIFPGFAPEMDPVHSQMGLTGVRSKGLSMQDKGLAAKRCFAPFGDEGNEYTVRMIKVAICLQGYTSIHNEESKPDKFHALQGKPSDFGRKLHLVMRGKHCICDGHCGEEDVFQKDKPVPANLTTDHKEATIRQCPMETSNAGSTF